MAVKVEREKIKVFPFGIPVDYLLCTFWATNAATLPQFNSGLDVNLSRVIFQAIDLVSTNAVVVCDVADAMAYVGRSPNGSWDL